jgi:uncharacterized protein YjiK
LGWLLLGLAGVVVVKLTTIADRLNAEAVQLLRTNQFQVARDRLQQALVICRKVGDSPEERLRQRSGEGKTLKN